MKIKKILKLSFIFSFIVSIIFFCLSYFGMGEPLYKAILTSLFALVALMIVCLFFAGFIYILQIYIFDFLHDNQGKALEIKYQQDRQLKAEGITPFFPKTSFIGLITLFIAIFTLGGLLFLIQSYILELFFKDNSWLNEENSTIIVGFITILELSSIFSNSNRWLKRIWE